MWFTYILRCADNSYYVGHTNALAARLTQHNSRRASRWTATRLPIELVYKEAHRTERQAIKREKQIKKWSRKKKQSLINGDLTLLKCLSKTKH